MINQKALGLVGVLLAGAFAGVAIATTALLLREPAKGTGDYKLRDTNSQTVSVPTEKCEMYVYNEWIDINGNGWMEKGEFIEPSTFSLTDKVTFYFVCLRNKEHTNRLYVSIPDGDQLVLEHPGWNNKQYGLNIGLPERLKRVGKYKAEFYIDDKLMQEREFEIAPSLVPCSVR